MALETNIHLKSEWCRITYIYIHHAHVVLHVSLYIAFMYSILVGVCVGVCVEGGSNSLAVEGRAGRSKVTGKKPQGQRAAFHKSHHPRLRLIPVHVCFILLACHGLAGLLPEVIICPPGSATALTAYSLRIFKGYAATITSANQQQKRVYTSAPALGPAVTDGQGKITITTVQFDANTSYVFAVRAKNAAGASPWTLFDYTLGSYASPTTKAPTRAPTKAPTTTFNSSCPVPPLRTSGKPDVRCCYFHPSSSASSSLHTSFVCILPLDVLICLLLPCPSPFWHCIVFFRLFLSKTLL